MLSSKTKKNIKLKFKEIYNKIYNYNDIEIYSNEIIDLINKSNKIRKR